MISLKTKGKTQGIGFLGMIIFRSYRDALDNVTVLALWGKYFRINLIIYIYINRFI